jgi:hypothetical protein
MSLICSCETVVGNTGLPACSTGASVAKGIFLFPQFANDGTSNEIDVTDTIDDAYILAKVRHADPSKRWYPIQDIKNVTTDRADPVYDTAGDGSKAFVKDGLRTFSFECWSGGARLKKQLDKARCRSFAFFGIEEGRINGIDRTDTQLILNGIRIAPDSLVVKYVAPTDALKEKLLVTLDVDQRELDSNMSYVEVADDADLTGYRGLLDIYSTIPANTLTTVTLELYNKYGAANAKNVLSGLVAADFALYNVTDSAAVTVSSSVESPDGTYLISFTAQTANDVLRITPTKAGYDFTAVVANTSILTA